MLVTAAEDCSASERLQFRSDPLSVRQALAAVTGTLTRQGVIAEDRATAELVLAEALNNVVEHAYRGRPDGVIELSLCLKASELACSITDTGLPMPGGCLPEGKAPAPEDLPEGGFGWPLIRSLCRGLDYQRAGDRNRLNLTVPATRRP